MPISPWGKLIYHDPSNSLLFNYKLKTVEESKNGVTFEYSADSKNEFVKSRFTPKRIIFNGPATIVFWKDGTKTIVKRAEKDPDNKYNAFCAALAKKIFESNSKVNSIIKSGEINKED